MNKLRRTTLHKIIAQLEELKEALSDLQDDEEDYRDNIPENLQGSSKYEKSDEAVSNIEDAIGDLEDVIINLEAAAE